MNPTTTTPDYIKARAEALYPYDLENTIGQNRDNQLKKEGYLKGCTDTLDGSAGNWVKCSERFPNPLDRRIFRWESSGGGIYIDLYSGHNAPTAFQGFDLDSVEWLDPSTPTTSYREAAEAMAKALGGAHAALKWMFENMTVDNKDLQSDAFNIPANAITKVEESLELYKSILK